MAGEGASSAAPPPRTSSSTRWKQIEEKRWEDFEKVDPRMDLSAYDPAIFSPYWGELYCFLLSNVIGCSTFIAVCGVLTLATVNREIVWDRALARWVTRSNAGSFDEARRELRQCRAYNFGVRELTKLAALNTAPSTKYGHLDGSDNLGIPFSLNTLNIMTSFNTTPLGFARAHFPDAILCYLVAMSIKTSQRYVSPLIFVSPIVLVGWGLAITYYSSRLLNILGHKEPMQFDDHFQDFDLEAGDSSPGTGPSILPPP